MSDSSDSQPEPSNAEAVSKLLSHLKSARGFDFGAYKLTGLLRRIQKRMREIGTATYADYLEYLEVHPQEFAPLFDTVVTSAPSFFRAPAAWQSLAEHVLPRIAEERTPDQPIRVWSAGCASGEEALTLAMLFAEALGEEQLRSRVKIYATDADEEALAEARRATYEARQMTGVPPDMLEKDFDKTDGRFTFRPDLRRCLIFGRHDLTQDAAISRLDLLVCRNTLMYFNSEAQEKILARFHFALSRDGFLFLGRAETLLTHGHSFRPIDLKHRVFALAASSDLRDRLLALSAPASPPPLASRPPTRQRLVDLSFDQAPVAQIAVDERGCLTLANASARKLFGLGNADLGRLLQDLEVSYRPVELRSLLQEAFKTREPVGVADVEWRGPGREERHYEVQVVPLAEPDGAMIGAAVSFVDLTHARRLRQELERTHAEREAAYEELQSANEELETTNEELHSTVEELETTNEELQSANEEQETMNEELQSTNEELRALNDRLQQGSEEGGLVTAYLRPILTSLR